MDTKTIESAKRADLVAELKRLGLEYKDDQPNKELRAMLLKYNEEHQETSEVEQPAEEQAPEVKEEAKEEKKEETPVQSNSRIASVIGARRREAETGLKHETTDLQQAMAARRAAAGQSSTGASIAEIIQQRRRK